MNVHHDRSQTSDRAKFTPVPTAMPPATYAYTLDESRFQLCPDDHGKRVWRRPGQRADVAFTFAHHTGPKLRVMVWKDKARPLAARVAMDCFTACQTLPWPTRSPDLSSIEHVWDIMGRPLHLPGNVDDLAQ
ncbi:transposable element Tc1 transposase [Trichonephila clavipes]|nr:transposable element Tc1 transposase [Trichonephila clavipes]